MLYCANENDHRSRGSCRRDTDTHHCSAPPASWVQRRQTASQGAYHQSLAYRGYHATAHGCQDNTTAVVLLLPASEAIHAEV